MQSEYGNINSPQELLEFMNNNFNYGYVDKNNQKHNEFTDNFIVQSGNAMIQNKWGNCFDAVEFERFWFTNHNYEFITIFEMVKLDYPNNYPMHSYLVYKENGCYHYFEWADYNLRGIHSFDTFLEAINYQFEHYLKVLDGLNITEEEKQKIIRKSYKKVEGNISILDFLKNVCNSEDVSEVSKIF